MQARHSRGNCFRRDISRGKFYSRYSQGNCYRLQARYSRGNCFSRDTVEKIASGEIQLRKFYAGETQSRNLFQVRYS